MSQAASAIHPPQEHAAQPRRGWQSLNKRHMEKQHQSVFDLHVCACACMCVPACMLVCIKLVVVWKRFNLSPSDMHFFSSFTSDDLFTSDLCTGDDYKSVTYR